MTHLKRNTNMQAKRFIAADMRRALDMVKNEFGEDAMIMSTERTAKGVELVATIEQPIEHLRDQHSLTQELPNNHLNIQKQNIASAAARFQSIPTPSSPVMQRYSNSVSSNQPVGPASGKTKQQLAEELELANKKMQAARRVESATLEDWADKQNAQGSLQQKNAQLDKRDEEIHRLHEEIVDMRHTLELQISTLAESHQQQYIQSQSVNNSTLSEVESISLQDVSVNRQRNHPKTNNSGSAISHHIVGEIKQHLDFIGLNKSCNDALIRSISDKNMPLDNKQRLWTQVLAQLSKNIPSDISDPISKGGIYAFLGTTGVGKTTTIAKLAARHVMEYGAEDVVLLTTDNYRISSHNQLVSLAKILNVKVDVVEKLQDLPQIIDQYRHASLVLIDTPGMSHSDRLLKPHLQLLRQSKDVNNVLVLSATSQYQMMKSSLHSYRFAGLSYAVMTKLDECASLGDALSVMFEQELPLAYMTDGQSVPEDLSILKSSQWVTKAVTIAKSMSGSSQKSRYAKHQ